MILLDISVFSCDFASFAEDGPKLARGVKAIHAPKPSFHGTVFTAHISWALPQALASSGILLPSCMRLAPTLRVTGLTEGG
jgi:hypothetical protein